MKLGKVYCYFYLHAQVMTFKTYCELDSSFEDLLKEFNIDV